MKDQTSARLTAAIQNYGASVYRTAYHYTLNPMDAEDIMQEAFCRYLSSVPNFIEGKHEKAWLLRVTINLSKSWLRSAWRRRTVPYVGQEHAQKASPEVFDSIKQLKPSHRTVIYLYYYEGYSVLEIAALIGCSETAVQTRLYRARKTLRGFLEEKI